MSRLDPSQLTGRVICRSNPVLTTHNPGPEVMGIDEFEEFGPNRRPFNAWSIVQTDVPGARPSGECGGRRMVEGAS